MAKPYSKHALRQVANLCIKAARVLMASGAETARVENTVSYIGRACKIPVESFATPTGITITVGGEKTITVVTRVKTRTIDLDKVILINNISRALAAGKIPFQVAERRVNEVLHQKPIFSEWLIYFSQAVCCAGFALIFEPNPRLIPPALLVGLLAKYVEKKCVTLPPFLLFFINALAVTLFANLYCNHIFPVEHWALVLAGIVPLLPGLALTNAIADLMAGELVAGMARTIDALLTGAGLAAGAAAGISLGQIL